jgi:hypothetical protein
MTIEELEHDLERLAEPQEQDERLRLAIRAELADRALVRPRRRMRPAVVSRWAPAAAAATAAAVTATILALGFGTSAGPSTADAAIIHHAAQALTSPANEIVHVKEIGVENGTPVSAEWWQQTSPPYALRMIKGPVGQQIEAADNGTTSFRYDAATNTILKTADSSAVGLVDPMAGVREQLAHGQAHVIGTATIDGTNTYKIGLPSGVVAYFDTTDYRPLYVDNPQRDGTVVRTRVVTFEELPTTPENAKLLSLTAQHPGARVETNTASTPVK